MHLLGGTRLLAIALAMMAFTGLAVASDQAAELGDVTAWSTTATESSPGAVPDIGVIHRTVTTLSPLVVGKRRYLIPIDYITYFGPLNVLSATFPGFTPVVGSRGNCLSISDKANACIRFDLTSWVKSNIVALNNIKINYGKPSATDLLGYEFYQIGPPNARTRQYVKSTPDIGITLATCIMSVNSISSICQAWFPLGDGNGAHFIFELADLQYLEPIEQGIRKLMSRFLSDAVD